MYNVVMPAQLIQTIRVDGQISWNCLRARGGSFVAICDPLRLTIQSDTWSELMEDISLTLDAMMKDLLTSNELDKFLTEHGWTLLGPIPTHPENARFDMPFLTAMAEANGPQRHVHQ